MNEWWPSVEVTCCNYRTHSLIHSELVSIGKDRFCKSDCEANNCPLHKSNGCVEIEKENQK